MRASLSAFCPTRFLLASCRRYCRNSPFSSVLSGRPVLLSVHSPSCFLTSQEIHLSKGPGRKCSPIPALCHKPRHVFEGYLWRTSSSLTIAVLWARAGFELCSLPTRHWNIPPSISPVESAGSARSWVFLNPCWQIPPLVCIVCMSSCLGTPLYHAGCASLCSPSCPSHDLPDGKLPRPAWI